MKRVSCYKTTDGLLFEDEQQAALHEQKLEFRQWYEHNKLYGRYEGSYIETENLDEWLKVNADKIRSYIDALCAGNIN